MKNTPTIRTHKQLCKLLFFRLSTYKKIHLLTIIILTLVSATGCSKDKMDSAQNDPTSNENSVDSNSNMDKTKTLTFNTNMNHCETLLNKNSASENKNNPKNYNKAGYSLYKQKKYNEAALLFRCSTLQDKNYTVGYYNLACTMALLHKQGVNVDINEIFILLRKSVELDPERIEKIRTDSDLDSIRETAEYKKLVSEASIPKANKSPLVEKLCAFENWTFVDSEGPPPTYIFTDKEYCLMGASLKYTKKNPEMIYEFGTYTIEDDNIILHDENNTSFIYLENREIKVLSASGDPDDFEIYKGNFLKNISHSYVMYGTDKSSLQLNEQILNELKDLAKNK